MIKLAFVWFSSDEYILSQVYSWDDDRWKNEAMKKCNCMILTTDFIKHTGKDNWIPQVFTVIIIYLLT